VVDCSTTEPVVADDKLDYLWGLYYRYRRRGLQEMAGLIWGFWSSSTSSAFQIEELGLSII
jgi:hypothetical protein